MGQALRRHLERTLSSGSSHPSGEEQENKQQTWYVSRCRATEHQSLEFGREARTLDIDLGPLAHGRCLEQEG